MGDRTRSNNLETLFIYPPPPHDAYVDFLAYAWWYGRFGDADRLPAEPPEEAGETTGTKAALPPAATKHLATSIVSGPVLTGEMIWQSTYGSSPKPGSMVGAPAHAQVGDHWADAYGTVWTALGIIGGSPSAPARAPAPAPAPAVPHGLWIGTCPCHRGVSPAPGSFIFSFLPSNPVIGQTESIGASCLFDFRAMPTPPASFGKFTQATTAASGTYTVDVGQTIPAMPPPPAKLSAHEFSVAVESLKSQAQRIDGKWRVSAELVLKFRVDPAELIELGWESSVNADEMILPSGRWL